jgi:hypothetical protein
LDSHQLGGDQIGVGLYIHVLLRSSSSTWGAPARMGVRPVNSARRVKFHSRNRPASAAERSRHQIRFIDV